MLKFGLFFLTTVIVLVHSDHTFFGTNVLRPLIHKEEIEYSSKWFSKRVEYYSYTMPPHIGSGQRTIQGVLAYDKTHTTASANITAGGLGQDFLTVRMKSESGEKLHYEIFIYA